MPANTEKTGCCLPVRAATADVPDSIAVAAFETGTMARVNIPGGKGLIGTDRPELSVDGEAPLRKTRVRSFVMDVTSVTNLRFRQFVTDTGYLTEAERIGNSFVFENLLPLDAPPTRAVAAVPWWRVVEGASWATPLGPGSEAACLDDHPVVHVSWNDAMVFARWAGGRLPTEVEWEHAARGGLGDVRFPWGDAEPTDSDFFPCNIWQGRFPDHDHGRDGYAGTAPARSYSPNGYGLYNLVGNVWEYTSQPFKVKSLKKTTQRVHAGKVGYKVGKGGSFLCHASYCYRYRIAARTGTSADSSTSHQGFRLVYDK
ncbi:Serine/threonine-protein kinase pkn1 (plasmid) [Sulfitobacter sp. DSM 110093]|uniref:formylglycine-generating enzyme family protein n=1 Tax=Sulfitobacter sp. DSM 110093 TaxID=2883127 RepID=UPI001FAE6617|nr:formylglycine-generating enzyme family protein [Sulfitobacter sp. DSM 110093]UOA33849.1 Serine/threonine-protein kinase pkn1 [Sulfitobacter sp. DSM 110093]